MRDLPSIAFAPQKRVDLRGVVRIAVGQKAAETKGRR
jgi:hypothetical protein